MEKIAMIFIILIALGAAIGIIFYFLFPPVNASELLDKIFEKAGKVKEVGISYSISFTSFYDSSETTTQGSLDFIYANGNSKSLIKLQSPQYLYFSLNSSELGFPPKYSEVEVYSIPEGNVVCVKTSIITQEYYCSEFEPIQTIGEYPSDLASQSKLIKEWLEKKIINASYLGKKEFINRKCDYFKFDVDINKLMNELRTGISIRGQNSSYTIYSCYDEELGFNLYFSYEIAINYSYGRYSYSSGYKGTYEPKSLSFDVDETQIKLPVSLDKVSWLPRFEIIETLCPEGSKEIKLAIESTKDLPSGNATLNISSTETLTSYPYAEVDGYNHYCFSLSDIRYGTTLRFTFSSISDSFSRQFIIGIDCSEAHGKKLYPSYSYGCEDCSGGGKYCSMGTYRYPSYTFYSDYLGTHEICVWPTSERNYTWQLDKIEVQKMVQHTIKSDFEGMKKGETKILSFTVPFSFKKNEYYYLNLDIGGFKSSGYCYVSKSQSPVLTGFFGKLLEKIINITQPT
ncbi:MAG: hypothetical protein ACP5O8_00080 [Candidatus Aenigmatarchaeota archaeon]